MSRTYECLGMSLTGRKTENQDFGFGFSNAKQNFYMIADGLSDCPESRKASFLAVAAVYYILMQKSKLPDGKPREWLREAMKKAGDSVYRMNAVKDAQGEVQVAKKGRTTLDVALIRDHILYVAHIGDGRVYALNKSGKLELLTKDHTNSRGELERCFGSSPDLDFDEKEIPLDNHKMVYLATDGIYKFVSDAETEQFLNENVPLDKIITNIFSRAEKPVAVAEELSRKHGMPVGRARASLISKGDNMTASVVRWGED